MPSALACSSARRSAARRSLVRGGASRLIAAVNQVALNGHSTATSAWVAGLRVSRCVFASSERFRGGQLAPVETFVQTERLPSVPPGRLRSVRLERTPRARAGTSTRIRSLGASTSRRTVSARHAPSPDTARSLRVPGRSVVAQFEIADRMRSAAVSASAGEQPHCWANRSRTRLGPSAGMSA